MTGGESAQEKASYQLTSKQEDEEDAVEAAQLRQFSDMLVQRRSAEKAAAKKGGLTQMPYTQIVIPSTGRFLQRSGGGRPTVVNQELREKIVLLLGGGASLTQAAALVGIARSTLSLAMARNEDFAREVHEARQRAMLFPLNCLLREASRNWRAAAWLLCYLDRKCEQERSRRERLLDAAGQEIEHDVVQELRERARHNRKSAKGDQQPADALPRKPRLRRLSGLRPAAQPARACACGENPPPAAEQ